MKIRIKVGEVDFIYEEESEPGSPEITNNYKRTGEKSQSITFMENVERLIKSLSEANKAISYD